MSIIWMVVVGLLVGAVAKLVMPGRDSGGVLATMLLGVGGSILAWAIGRAVGWYASGDAVGLVASVIGAVILLAIYRWFVGRSITRGGRYDKAA